MKHEEMPQKGRSGHVQKRGEISPEDMRNTKLVVAMRLLQELKISFEPIFTFPPLNFRLHLCEVGGELERLAIAEPDVVIGLTFDELYAFSFE